MIDRREFLRKGGKGLAGLIGLTISGCVKNITDDFKSQKGIGPPLIKIPYETRTLHVDIKSEIISSAYVYAPFDEAKNILNGKKFKVISPEDNVRLRIHQGADSFVFEYGNYTRAGIVYIPKKGAFLVRNSPVLVYPEIAVNAQKNGGEFCIDDKQVEKALEDSVQVPYDLNFISTKRLADEEITAYSFGEHAKVYGEFLDDAGIKKMSIRLVCESNINEQSKPFVRQLWLGSCNYSSGLSGDSKYLSICARVRGICGDIKDIAKIRKALK